MFVISESNTVSDSKAFNEESISDPMKTVRMLSHVQQPTLSAMVSKSEAEETINPDMATLTMPHSKIGNNSCVFLSY